MSIVSGASYTLKSIVKRYLALVFILCSKQPDYRALSMKQLDKIRTEDGKYMEKTLTVILGHIRAQKCRIRYLKRKILHIYLRQSAIEAHRYFTYFQTDDMQWYAIHLIESGVQWNKSFKYEMISADVLALRPNIPANNLYNLTLAVYHVHLQFSTKKLTRRQFNIEMAKLYRPYMIELVNPHINESNVVAAVYELFCEIDFMTKISDAFTAAD